MFSKFSFTSLFTNTLGMTKNTNDACFLLAGYVPINCILQLSIITPASNPNIQSNRLIISFL